MQAYIARMLELQFVLTNFPVLSHSQVNIGVGPKSDLLYLNPWAMANYSPYRVQERFKTARLFLNHLGLLGMEGVKVSFDPNRVV